MLSIVIMIIIVADHQTKDLKEANEIKIWQ